MAESSLTWNDLDSGAFMAYGTLYILFTDLVLYPADLLTTRLQADKHSNGSIAIWPIVKEVLRREGPVGLYRGFSTLAIGSFPGQFFYYLAYEYSNELLRRIFHYDPAHSSFYPTLLANAAAGMIAEGVSAITYLPTDIISQRQQVQRRVDFLPARYHNHRTWSIIRHVWKTEGLGGFYRGFLPYMIVHGPGSAVWWAFYEATKHGLNNFRNTIKLNENRSSSLAGDAVTTLLSGVVAGVASCVITNPLEVAKTRMQLLEVADPRERANLQGGFRSILVDIYRREGFGGLYKGMRPRVLVKIPGFAAVFLGYECLKEVCRS